MRKKITYLLIVIMTLSLLLGCSSNLPIEDQPQILGRSELTEISADELEAMINSFYYELKQEFNENYGWGDKIRTLELLIIIYQNELARRN